MPRSNVAPGAGFFAALGVAAAIATCAAACEPLGLGLPTTLELERGAADTLNASHSFELSGSYIVSGVPWTIDLQLARPQNEHISVTQGTTHLEALLVGDKAYFRSQDFLSQHLGAASGTRSLIDAAGTAWWTGTASDLPDLADLTDGSRMRAAFLGSVVTQRQDHVSVDGTDAALFSGPRADVYISEAAPHRLIRLRIRPPATVDGIVAGDLHYSNFDHDFGIVAPTDVIDFSNLSTLPPAYTVVSVDTSLCASPCVASAVVRNLGGKLGGRAPSTITFTITDSVSGVILGTCSVQVTPDIDYNATASVSCTINVTGLNFNSAVVTATPDNPGHA